MARDRVEWYQKLVRSLETAARAAGVTNAELRRALKVELGLYALSRWAPEAAASEGWALLKGLDFRPEAHTAPGMNTSPRWLIGELKGDQDWQDALAAYAEFPEHLRLFRVKDPHEPAVERELTDKAARLSAYAKALARPPRHRPLGKPLACAETTYTFEGNGTRHRVRLPHSVVPAPATGHDEGRRRRRMRINWTSLLATAKQMDTADAREGRSNNWHGRIHDLQLRLRDDRGRLRPARQLLLEDLIHLVGMPAVGKTSLLTVVAVWAAGKGYTITLVLGDVISVLNMVSDVNRYVAGAAAPILGASTRGQHLRQLHRPPDPTVIGPELLRDERLRWVSTACQLQGLMPQLTMPLPLADAPCGRLKLIEDSDDGGAETGISRKGTSHACPLFFSCGRHEAARGLVAAPVWVATAPSLLHCLVPTQLIDKEMRYLELAWRRSDVIAFDEADRVQIQLDQAFSPAQTLAGPGKDAYLDEVRPLFETHSRATHGRHLTISSTVRDWSISLNSAGMLVARLRALLGEHRHVREWLRKEYFNEWRLGVALATEISLRPPDGAPVEADRRHWQRDESVYEQWWATLRAWLLDAAGPYDGDDRRVSALRALSARGYDDTGKITNRLVDWLQDQPDVILDGGEPLRRLAVRFQVAMVTALLAQQLAHLTRYSWEVESETGAEGMSSSLVHRPPAESLAARPGEPDGQPAGVPVPGG